MDKRVIFAVAGSGKTKFIINKLNLHERYLIVTFTNNNIENIRIRIIDKFGYFPENIRLYSYFSFLYGFCYRPFLQSTLGTNGILYKPNKNTYAKMNNRNYYVDDYNRIYSNRIAKAIINYDSINHVIKRIEKYFDHFFIDEVQDFAGYDFNLLPYFAKTNIDQLYVGDFYQHTFDTSRDGNVNNCLYEDYGKYLLRFKHMGFEPDITTLKKSFRCSPTICEF